MSFLNLDRTTSNVILVPSLPHDVADRFISKMVLTNFEFDDGGREIPGLDTNALKVLNRLPQAIKTEMFTAKSFDSRSNYEDLEYIGDAALKHAVTHLIEKKHSDLDRGWKNVSTALA